jgi:hypothetical protein
VVQTKSGVNESTALLSSQSVNDDTLTATNDNAADAKVCGGLFDFSGSFWLLTAAIFLFYAAVNPWNNIGSQFLMNHVSATRHDHTPFGCCCAFYAFMYICAASITIVWYIITRSGSIISYSLLGNCTWWQFINWFIG